MGNYKNGTRFEYDVRDYFMSKGYNVGRFAGSHGAADLIVWNKEEVILIQCKKEKRKVNHRDDWSALENLITPNGWKKQLWVKRDRIIFVHDVLSSHVDCMYLKDFNSVCVAAKGVKDAD